MALNTLVGQIEDCDEGGDDRPINLFISPPDDDGNETAEDSGDEEGGTINNLCAGQLRADAKVQNLEPNDDESSSDEDEAPRPKQPKKSRVWKTPGEVEQRGLSVELESIINENNFVDKDIPDWFSEKLWTPVELFEKMFTDAFALIQRQTIIYARQNGDHTFTLTESELRVCTAILMLSGYAPLPRRNMYWQEQSDCLNSAVSKAIRRDKFDKFMKYLHLCNNASVGDGTRLKKVSTYLHMLRVSFQRCAYLSRFSDIDESMIEYFGKYGGSLKQFIRGKPIRFGYKVWSQNFPNGYLYNFSVYQGKDTFAADYDQPNAGSKVVWHFANNMPDLADTKQYIFVDNFFTSLPLLQSLKEKDIGCVGTLRRNRTQGCPLTEQKTFRAQERGSMEVKVNENGLSIVHWNDNSCVVAASNCSSALPTKSVKRWSSSAKTYVNVPQPFLISVYNTKMGGTDRMDQNVNKYRINIRTKKWWYPFFSWGIDVTLQNAWLLYRNMGNNIDLLAFKRIIVQSYLSVHGSAPGRNPTVQPRNLPDEMRLSNRTHLIVIDNAHRLSCKVCKIKTNRKCESCNVFLHDKCFKQYHS